MSCSPTITRTNIKWKIIWALSSEFVSSSIPSWHILTAHAQPFRGARDLAFCLKVPLDSLLVWASSEGSGETARMRRLVWTFAARIGDKYQIRLARSISFDVKLAFNSTLNEIILSFNGVVSFAVVTMPSPINVWTYPFKTCFCGLSSCVYLFIQFQIEAALSVYTIMLLI